MEFRDHLLSLANRVIRQIGGPTPWEATGLEWMESGPAPPEELAGLDFEVESIYDLANPSLARLRETSSSVTLEVSDSSCQATWKVNVPVSELPEVAVVTMAEQMQDHVLESADSYGMPLPPCPVHGGHPLSPAVAARRAVWRCPASQAVIGAIGGPDDV